MLRMTAKEYQEMLKQQATKKPGNKHHNKIVYIYADGLVSEYKDLSGHGDIVRRYDSKKEYNRHKELKLLERSGKISNLRWQVPILLQDGVTDAAGKKIRPIFYTADFTYVENGTDIVEDGAPPAEMEVARRQIPEQDIQDLLKNIENPLSHIREGFVVVRNKKRAGKPALKIGIESSPYLNFVKAQARW